MYHDIYKAIDLIRTRPGMFIEKKSVYNLSIFLEGYRFALYNNSAIQDEIRGSSLSFEPLPFFLFHSFVANRYNESACMGWCRIILLQTENDEEKGLDLFFQLLDQFRAIKILHCQVVVLTPENIMFHNTSDKVAKQIIMNNKQLSTVSITVEQIGTPSEDRSSSEEFDFDKAQKVPIYMNAQSIYCIQLTDNNGYLFVVEYKDALCCEFLTVSKEEVFQHVKKCFGKVEWQNADTAVFHNKPIYRGRTILDLEGNCNYW